jgi:hypothetical protein
MSEEIISTLNKICDDNFYVFEGRGTNPFAECADFLMNKCILETAKGQYRLTTIEFYKHSTKHQDEFTYGYRYYKDTPGEIHPQLKTGELFFHYSGIDITFGKQNGTENIFGGILLRGIRNIKTDKLVNGPWNVFDELFKNLNVIEGHHILKLTQYNLPSVSISVSQRTNLRKSTLKFPERDKCLNAEYRFEVKG